MTFRPIADAAPGHVSGFTWRDGGRVILFRPGRSGEESAELRSHGFGPYELLSTRRALEEAPNSLIENAKAVHEVAAGPVTETAAGIVNAVSEPNLVGFGGGRVIDTAKAIAAVRGGRVAAIPTTLSGAEMTAIHRLPAGHEDTGTRIRPALVLADADAMTSLPEEPLRASALNALAHAIEALYTPLSNPVATMAALKGASLISDGLDRPRESRDRSGLALGGLLSAYALDSAGLGLHHVICQSLVREMRMPHAPTYAAMLPVTVEAMAARAPAEMSALAAAIGAEISNLASRIRNLGGGSRKLSEIGADSSKLDRTVESAINRPELVEMPSPPDRAELRSLIDAAW